MSLTQARDGRQAAPSYRRLSGVIHTLTDRGVWTQYPIRSTLRAIASRVTGVARFDTRVTLTATADSEHPHEVLWVIPRAELARLGLDAAADHVVGIADASEVTAAPPPATLTIEDHDPSLGVPRGYRAVRDPETNELHWEWCGYTLKVYADGSTRRVPVRPPGGSSRQASHPPSAEGKP